MMFLIKLVVIIYVLRELAEFVGEVLFDIEIENKLIRFSTFALAYMLSCNKCFAFWVTLAASGDLFIACLYSLLFTTIAFVENKIIDKKTKLK